MEEGNEPLVKKRPDRTDYLWLVKKLKDERGFWWIDGKSVRDDIERFKLVPPTLKKKYREVGLRFSANGYTVKVWTSFVEELQAFQDDDQGYVLIVRDRDNVPVYYAQYTRRTKNFAYNLYMRARIAQSRVRARPLCTDSECLCRMGIAKGRNGKGLVWECLNDEHHGFRKGPRKSIDLGLDAEELKFAKARRKDKKRDREDVRRVAERGNGSGNKKGWQQNFMPADSTSA